MESLKKNRAWIELNLDNLEHNIKEIQKIIPDKTKIMAVVKANAYGHGIVEISQKLNEKGIMDFAVATLEEGIILRKNNIRGNILILGYTSLENISLVQKYNLIQTIVDYNYALKISNLALKDPLLAHVKINTGMNRMGENYHNLSSLEKIYHMKNIQVIGTFSHLSSSDSLAKEDVDFTKKQIDNFESCISTLKARNCQVGKVHIQASYGIINYNELQYDYVRPGIILYGLLSSDKDKIKTNISLKPVLSLKARVISIKSLKINEAVSYGRSYICKNDRLIASVSIGYADGILRMLSNKSLKVRVKDYYAEVIGRICMDQLMIDITGCKNIEVGDEVTLIDSNDDKVSIYNMASKAGTITNDILTGLGRRLEVCLKEKED